MSGHNLQRSPTQLKTCGLTDKALENLPDHEDRLYSNTRSPYSQIYIYIFFVQFSRAAIHSGNATSASRERFKGGDRRESREDRDFRSKDPSHFFPRISSQEESLRSLEKIRWKTKEKKKHTSVPGVRSHARTHAHTRNASEHSHGLGAGNTARIAYGGSYMYTYICTRYTQLYN